MVGVVAFAVSDSAFAYLTEANNYGGGGILDTGWVAGYLLIALGALWAMTSPVPEVSKSLDSTVSIVAPYVPVLVVLAVTAYELVRGSHLGTVSWLMAFALAVLVIVREGVLMLKDRYSGSKGQPDAYEDHHLEPRPDVASALSNR